MKVYYPIFLNKTPEIMGLDFIELFILSFGLIFNFLVNLNQVFEILSIALIILIKRFFFMKIDFIGICKSKTIKKLNWIKDVEKWSQR